MPSNIRIFFWITVALIAYWILSAGWRLESYRGHSINNAIIFVTIGSLTIQCLIYLVPAWLAAFRRQNWARWAFAVVVVTMQILSLWQATYLYLHGSTERFRQIGQIVLRGYLTSPGTITETALLIVATVLVFTGNARDWFRRPRTSCAGAANVA
jgi:hypothetical protein